MGIPMVGYIDDFWAICRSDLLDDAGLAFRSLCRALGVALKPGKADAGNAIDFIGLFGGSPSPANDYQLRISLPHGEARRRAVLIDETFKNGPIQLSTLGKLIGKISFSQTSLFGELSR